MLKIAICDDNKEELEYASEMLQEMLEHSGTDYNLQVFGSAKEMLEKVKQTDVAILDISMEELNGIDLGRALKIRYPEVKLIYTTSYEKYCMQAINEAHAFSFLCKPLEKEKLQGQLLELVNERKTSACMREKTFYRVLDDKKRELPAVTLRLDDILYFECIKSMREITIVLKERTYQCPYIMEKLTKELEDCGFATNCRGQLVNLRHISKIKGYDIYLHNGQKLALSQKRSVEFKKSMNDFLHNHI